MRGRVEAGSGPGGALAVLRRVVVMVVVMMVVVGGVRVQSLGLVGRHVEGGLLDGVGLSRRLLKPVSSDPTQRRSEGLSRLRAEVVAVHAHRSTEVSTAVPVLMGRVRAGAAAGARSRRTS